MLSEEVERLVAENLDIVEQKVWPLCGCGHDDGVLRSAALEGLWSAAVRWDGVSCAFRTLAHRFIAYSLQDALRSAYGRTEGGQEKRGSNLSIVPLDAVTDDGQVIADGVADPGVEMPFDGLLAAEKTAALERLIQKAPLTDNEEMVLRWYYFEETTLGKIAQAFGLTESRISQVLKKALGKLRLAAVGFAGPR